MTVPATVDPVSALGRAPGRRRAGRALAIAAIGLPGLTVATVALVGPLLAPHDPARPVGAPLQRPFQGSGADTILGTDHLGRDVLSQVLHGGATVVLVPVAATAVAVVLGAAIGMLAAYRGRWVGVTLERATRLLLVLPPVLVLLVLISGWGASPWVLGLAVVLFTVPATSRYARAVTATVLRSGYVEAAVALGERPGAVLRREVLPAVTGPVLADAGLRLVGAIYLVATAGFLGYGDGGQNWAAMIAENIGIAQLNPAAVLAPAACVAALTVSANLAADRFAARLRP